MTELPEDYMQVIRKSMREADHHTMTVKQAVIKRNLIAANVEFTKDDKFRLTIKRGSDFTKGKWVFRVDTKDGKKYKAELGLSIRF